jgi:signal transduction histidine kinase
MKLSRIGIALFVLFLIGAAIFAGFLIKQEQKYKTGDFVNKGNHLVSLIALLPMQEFTGDRRDYFFRTLIEYTSNEGFLYLFIHDPAGRALASLVPGSFEALIPADVRTASLYATGLIHQKYGVTGSGDTFYEFAKPIFQRGKKAGMVRLGMRFPAISVFSLERLSLLAIMAFFIFGGLVLGYYGIILALNPLRKVSQNLKAAFFDPPVEDAASKGDDITPIIKDIAQTISHMGEKIRSVEMDNVDLISRLGVTTFEKTQIINIIDSINFGIVITDLQDNVVHINDYMLRLLNRKRPELIDHSLEEVIPDGGFLGFVTYPDSSAKQDVRRYMEMTFPELAPGEIYRVTLAYLKGLDNAPSGKMFFFQNMTAESYVERAQQEFIAHVAHELQTPLTNIKLYSEMLMQGEVKDNETQKEFYNVINEQTIRLTTLIRNLLNLAKMEMGSLMLNRGLVKTDWFVEDCLMSIEATALDKDIGIDKNLPDTFPALMADKELLKTAVINILSNAVKYTPRGGRITFSISEEDGMVLFDISDTGHGIAEKDLPRIFEKFYRSEDDRIIEQTGSGLGLAITADIVRLHGGEIQVSSTVGKGSHFIIRIPKEEYHLGKT